MKNIIVSFFVVFLILLGIFSITGILKANLASYAAQNMHTDIINELENGNLSRTVMEKSIKRVADVGCELEIIPLTNAQGELLMAEVILRYEYSVPFLKVTNNFHEIHGYAR